MTGDPLLSSFVSFRDVTDVEAFPAERTCRRTTHERVFDRTGVTCVRFLTIASRHTSARFVFHAYVTYGSLVVHGACVRQIL
jgi:hypothetical protein